MRWPWFPPEIHELELKRKLIDIIQSKIQSKRLKHVVRQS